MTLRIDHMFAFVQTDPTDDTEGITGFLAPDGTWMPMVGADLERVEQLMPIAQGIASATGREIKVLKFSVREEIQKIIM